MLFAIAFLCTTQSAVEAAARRFATIAAKTILTAGIVGSSGYCRTHTLCANHETPQPFPTRSSSTLATAAFYDPKKLAVADIKPVGSVVIRKQPSSGFYSYSLAFTVTPQDKKTLMDFLVHHGLHPTEQYPEAFLSGCNLVECVFYFPKSDTLIFESMFL